MIVERFTRGPAPIYERAAERGRMLPTGLTYVDPPGGARAPPPKASGVSRTSASTLGG